MVARSAGARAAQTTTPTRCATSHATTEALKLYVYASAYHFSSRRVDHAWLRKSSHALAGFDSRNSAAPAADEPS